MPRILCIDYGRKRCGIAVTDPTQIIASPLDTVATAALKKFVLDYAAAEELEAVVIGFPRRTDGTESETAAFIKPFAAGLRKALPPTVRVDLADERFTTKIAFGAMIAGGLKRKDRNPKNGTVDKVSASIILQDYLELRRNSAPR